MAKLELKQIKIESPIDTLKIGDEFIYKGNYASGYEDGVSKIKHFYKEVAVWDGVKERMKKNSCITVWMELENSKNVLLGFLKYKNKFNIAKNLTLT